MKLRIAAAAALSICSSTAALAGGFQTGTITNLTVRAQDGLISFMLSGTASGQPACATHTYWLIKDENSNTGKQQYAFLLMARTTGTPVTVYGLGTCTRWSDGEDVNSVAQSN